MYATQSLQQPNLIIPKDPILETKACKQYEKFRIEDLKMDTFLENKEGLDAKFVKNYQSLNSDYYLGYYKTGLYYYQRKELKWAQQSFEMALTKEIATGPEKQAIEKYLKKIKKKITMIPKIEIA